MFITLYNFYKNEMLKENILNWNFTENMNKLSPIMQLIPRDYP